ncbi:MAG: ABC transporter ATP-binding protein, partial [Flavobacteriales bacterium]
AGANTIAEESFQGISIVKAFANEPFEVNRYKEAMREVVSFGLKRARWRGAFASFIIFCLFGSIVATTWYGATLVQSGQELSIGDLFSFILYTVFIGASIGGIASQYSSIQRAIGATEDLLDLLEEQGERLSVDKHQPLEHRLRGSVVFDAVSFSYPNREDVRVLKDVSFVAEAGSQVAIVGPSGAGKSTIVSLIMRFYDPLSGRITIDGRGAEEYPLSGLRGQMAVVPQEVILFGGSIRENIAYGKPGASIEEIVRAAGQANAAEFISGFPDGYDTVVGERGMQLSGGQRQRIAIARAVLKDPSILILDEATSSLDSESERLVQEALEKLMQGRTSFVIAHRLSTVRKAGQILVLDRGVVKETGTHESLIAMDGLYRSLCKLQFDLNEV